MKKTTQKQAVDLGMEFLIARNKDPENILYKGYPTPYSGMNFYFTGGLKPTEFSIWAARPSVGKTALLLDLAEAHADYGFPGLYFNLEMSELQIGLRLIAKRAGVNLAALADEQQDDAIMQGISEASKFSDATADLTIYSGSFSVEQLKHVVEEYDQNNSTHQSAIIYVDYLQLVSLEEGGGTRQQDLGKISRALKNDVAMGMGKHVAAAAQLSRKVEEREDRRPMMSDLREAGDIEQDADIVALLFRPSYYNLAEYTSKNNNRVVGYPDINEYLEVNLDKNRNGPTGVCDLFYDTSLGRFADWSV